MTTEQLRQLGRRAYDIINAQDLAGLDDVFAQDVVRHAARQVGLDQGKHAVAQAFAAAPDTHFRAEDVFAEGDRIALRVTVQRDGADAATILEIFRVEDGRVAEIWGAGTSA
jgi:predicted ester cyclase